MTVLLQTDLPNLMHRGKVRDTYDLGDGRRADVALPSVARADTAA